MSKAIGIIPARLNSTRLPGKMLLAETGKPLIQHTWEQACKARRLDSIYVATDSEEIAAVVRRFGGEVLMTGKHHESGTVRTFWGAVSLHTQMDDIVVNIQGDEPEIDPGHIDSVAMCVEVGYASIATVSTVLQSHERESQSAVKVVVGTKRRAIWFTRADIPLAERHVGLYAFRMVQLREFAWSDPTPLEKTESLEQMRAIHYGWPIYVHQVDSAAPGIDTPEDYAAFVKRQKKASQCPS